MTDTELLTDYTEFIFSRKKGDIVGFYASDRVADKLIAHVMKDGGLHKDENGEDLLPFIKSDAGTTGFSGLSRAKAWTYAGLGNAWGTY
jgi:hypothetical protein